MPVPLVKQSSTQLPLQFFLTQSSDHISGLTGATPSVKISKNGASGVSPTGAVSETDSTNMPGWYQVAANATDTNTLGLITLHATATSADPCDMPVAQVVAFDPTAANLAANVVQWNGQTALTDANNLPKVDVEDINGNATAAQNVSKANQAIGRGTCTTGGSTTSIPTSAWSPGGAGVVSGQFIGRTIIFDANTSTAALQGQATNITANTSGATPTFTVTALTTAPSSGDTFSVL